MAEDDTGLKQRADKARAKLADIATTGIDEEGKLTKDPAKAVQKFNGPPNSSMGRVHPHEVLSDDDLEDIKKRPTNVITEGE